jgi:hypothetical protein
MNNKIEINKMTSVEAPLNNDINFKPTKKMMVTDNRSTDGGNSMKMSNGYDIEKSISHGGSIINNS